MSSSTADSQNTFQICALSSLPLMSASTPLPPSSLKRISPFKSCFWVPFCLFPTLPEKHFSFSGGPAQPCRGCAPSPANLTTKTRGVATRGPECLRRRPRRREEDPSASPGARSASASSAASNPNYSAACTPSLASTGPTPQARQVFVGPRAEPPVPGTSPPTPRPATGEDAAAPAFPGSARPRPRM